MMMMRRTGLGWVLISASLLAGCSSSGGGTGVAGNERTAKAKIEKGTAVPMVLLGELSAGGTQVGTKVAFMVSDDVKDRDGRVVIPRGSLADGEVVVSRSEGMLSSVMNRPARLAVQFGELRTSRGYSVKLAASVEGITSDNYHFSRSDAARNAVSDELQKMIAGTEKSEVESLASSLQSFLETGDASSLEEDAKCKAALDKLLNAKGLEDAKKYLAPDSGSQESLDSLGKMLNDTKGGSLNSLNGADALLAVSALKELGNLAHTAENVLERWTKGRSLKAHFGTPVLAYAAEEVEVSVKEK